MEHYYFVYMFILKWILLIIAINANIIEKNEPCRRSESFVVWNYGIVSSPRWYFVVENRALSKFLRWWIVVVLLVHVGRRWVREHKDWDLWTNMRSCPAICNI